MAKSALIDEPKQNETLLSLKGANLPSLPDLTEKEQSQVLKLLRIICDKNADQASLLIKLGRAKTPDHNKRAPIITWVVAEACGIIEATPLFKDDNKKILDNLKILLNCDETNHLLPVIKGLKHFISNPLRNTFDLREQQWSSLIYSMIDISYRKVFVSRSIAPAFPKADLKNSQKGSPKLEVQSTAELMRETCEILLQKCQLGYHEVGKDKISIAEDCRRYIDEASK